MCGKMAVEGRQRKKFSCTELLQQLTIFHKTVSVATTGMLVEGADFVFWVRLDNVQLCVCTYPSHM